MGLNMIKVIENMFYFKNSGTNEISYPNVYFFQMQSDARNPQGTKRKFSQNQLPKDISSMYHFSIRIVRWVS